MTPDQYCQEKAARNGSTLYYSTLFLPAGQQRAVIALYALRHELDTVIEECTDISVARARLGWWHDELSALFQGNPTHPVTRALYPHLDACSVRPEQLLGIVDAVNADLEQTRYFDYASLQRHCHAIEGTLAEICCNIFGPPDAAAIRYARELGLAVQLTKIIRDVGNHARHGRIYLPVEDLQRFNVKAADILNRRHSDDFRALMQFQAERARASYARALELLPTAQRRVQRPGLIMAAIYYTLLNEIERDGFQVLHQRIGLTPLRKFWLAWKTWVTGGKVNLRPPKTR